MSDPNAQSDGTRETIEGTDPDMNVGDGGKKGSDEGAPDSDDFSQSDTSSDDERVELEDLP